MFRVAKTRSPLASSTVYTSVSEVTFATGVYKSVVPDTVAVPDVGGVAILIFPGPSGPKLSFAITLITLSCVPSVTVARSSDAVGIPLTITVLETVVADSFDEPSTAL